LGIGDWGLGIGDWGLGPIPNPQSPIPSFKKKEKIYLMKKLYLFIIIFSQKLNFIYKKCL